MRPPFPFRVKTLLLSALLISIPATTGWSQLNFDPATIREKAGREATLSDALGQLLGGPGKFQIIGSHDPLISQKIEATNSDDAMRQLKAMLPGLLIGREFDSYSVYVPDANSPAPNDPAAVDPAADDPAPEDPAAENPAADEDAEKIVYMYQCRESRASDLAKILRQQSVAIGFPRANAINVKKAGNALKPHKPKKSAQGAGAAESTSELLPGVEYHVISYQNAIMLIGTLAKIREALPVIKRIDNEIPSVRIEILIVQYFHDDQFTWRYNLADGALLKADPPKFIPPKTPLSQPVTTPVENFGPAPWGIDFQNLAFDPASGAASLAYSGIGTLTSQFKQNLTFLASEDLARVVTNPRIAVLNGETGQVLLDEKFNFVNSVVTANGTVSQKADNLESVTAINVTPTLLGPGRIHLAVNTTLTTFQGDANSTLPGQRISELGTSVVLSAGKSLILGGLVKEEVFEAREKIPGVAKIPLVGHLFRGKDELRRFSETVVYVIPHIGAPQGYEDEYLEEVFKHSRGLKERGETVRNEHRADKTASARLFHHKEQLDRMEHHNLHRELHPKPPWFRRDCDCAGVCNHGQPVEVVPSGSPELIETPRHADPPVNAEPQASTPPPVLIAPPETGRNSLTQRNGPRVAVAAPASYETAARPLQVIRRLPPIQAEAAVGRRNYVVRSVYQEPVAPRQPGR